VSGLDAHPDLAELAVARGLGAVFAWMAKRGVPLSAAVLTQQDEFSIDFVVPLDGRWVDFTIT
jgi:hypothetical protein